MTFRVTGEGRYHLADPNSGYQHTHDVVGSTHTCC